MIPSNIKLGILDLVEIGGVFWWFRSVTFLEDEEIERRFIDGPERDHGGFHHHSPGLRLLAS